MKAMPYMYRHGGHECAVDLRCIHLASIDVKSEDSILLKETITRSRHYTQGDMRGSTRRTSGRNLLGLVFPVASHEG